MQASVTSVRIVLFGATGYTGRLTAEAMVRAGLAPVLAGRRRDALARLADQFAALAPSPASRPTIAVADVTNPASVRDLLHSPDDVLVSTVGPFIEWGAPAIDAAIDAGAAYIDSTGEPPFIRRVFEHYGPRAQATGARLVTAFGYDYVPGNLAGALALRRCRRNGRHVARLDIGYFVDGTFGISSGTRASAAGVLLAPSFARKGGTLVARRSPGGRTRQFDLGRGRMWKAMPVAGSEHLALPLAEPGLNDIEVWLGWAGAWTSAASYAGTALGAVATVPGVGDRLMGGLRRRLSRTTGEGPDASARAGASTVVQAEAADIDGRTLATVRLEGPSPYDLTAELLAWGAAMASTKSISAGAHGPVDAFGLEELERGCADMGLVAVT
jgi:short subunit dehydrogenase-like uncharacterized protein